MGSCRPMLSFDQAVHFPIHLLAFAMAVLEFLLNCFRRRKPSSEQSRPLCTEEDSTQSENPSDLQPITPAYTEDLGHKAFTPSAASIRTFASPPAQHEPPPQQLGLDQGSNFGFNESLPGGFTAQVCISLRLLCKLSTSRLLYEKSTTAAHMET